MYKFVQDSGIEIAHAQLSKATVVRFLIHPFDDIIISLIESKVIKHVHLDRSVGV